MVIDPEGCMWLATSPREGNRDVLGESLNSYSEHKHKARSISEMRADLWKNSGNR